MDRFRDPLSAAAVLFVLLFMFCFWCRSVVFYVLYVEHPAVAVKHLHGSVFFCYDHILAFLRKEHGGGFHCHGHELTKPIR